MGNFLGAALGAITPFCSCSTIPMTVGLLRTQVPFGATMSFVPASPLLNPVILTMFWVLLGWKACVTHAVVTFVAAIVFGGAAMSIPEMSMLAAIFRPRLVGAFVAVVFLTAIPAGLTLNAI